MLRTDRFAPLAVVPLLLLLGLVGLLAACRAGGATPTVESAPNLVLYNWEDEIPQTVLDAFTAETGVTVDNIGYTTTEEAVASLRSGASYDVVIIENRFVGSLIEDGLLARLDMRRIPNFKNVSLNFRDLSFDPGNRYSIPYSWGTAGILMRSDLPGVSLTAWADFWDPAYCGRIGMWRGQMREIVSLTLKMLGYSANSEDPAELAEAETRLLALRPCVQIVDDSHIPKLIDSIRAEVYVAGLGYVYDAIQIRELGVSAQFVIPAEGALLWSDSMVIPTSSKNAAAAALIDFLLRPEISAQVANARYYQLANDAALPLIAPALRQDAMLYPTTESLRQAEILLPLTHEGEQRYAAIGAAFLQGAP